MNVRALIAISVTAAALTGCASYSPAVSPVSIDPRMQGPVAGVGIEGHHVIDMTDEMIRDLRQHPAFAGAAIPPQVIVDGTEFRNRGQQRIDKDIIANRLRVALNRAAGGDIVFVGRHYQSSVLHERMMKQSGAYDSGTIGLSAAPAGADYKLGGTIQTLTSRSPSTGMIEQYNLITFEMVDLDRGTIIWNNNYEFSAASADDVIYR